MSDIKRRVRTNSDRAREYARTIQALQTLAPEPAAAINWQVRRLRDECATYRVRLRRVEARLKELEGGPDE